MIRRLLLIALLALPGTSLAASAGRAAPGPSPAVEEATADKGQLHPLAISPSMVGAGDESESTDSDAEASAAPAATKPLPVTPSVGATSGRPEVEGPSESSAGEASAVPAAVKASPVTPSEVEKAADSSAVEASAEAAPVTPSEAEGPVGPNDSDAPAAPAELKQLDDSIARYRTPFEVLSERMIGEASRAVRFDWRKKTVGVGAVGSQLLELNNFWSARVGGFARVPFSSLMSEVAVTWVFARGSESTERLALTPYRQVGRPARLELDVNLGFPIAEGVATAWPSFFPATELVFSLDAGFRYIYYPGALSGAGFREVAGAIFSPRLNDRELENLEEDRLPAMEVDGGRYNVLAGGSLDLYFQSGFFLSPRVMVALPIMSQFTESGLGWWWELSLSLGWML